jgi:hypothetical protein
LIVFVLGAGYLWMYYKHKALPWNVRWRWPFYVD